MIFINTFGMVIGMQLVREKWSYLNAYMANTKEELQSNGNRRDVF